MPPPSAAAVLVAKKLVRHGLRATKIRSRIRSVVAAKAAAAMSPAEAAVEAETQLLNEAFAELRYRSILIAMRHDMPRIPLPSPAGGKGVGGESGGGGASMFPPFTARPPIASSTFRELATAPLSNSPRHKALMTSSPLPEPVPAPAAPTPDVVAPPTPTAAPPADAAPAVPPPPSPSPSPASKAQAQEAGQGTSDVEMDRILATLPDPDRRRSRLARLSRWWSRTSEEERLRQESRKGVALLESVRSVTPDGPDAPAADAPPGRAAPPDPQAILQVPPPPAPGTADARGAPDPLAKQSPLEIRFRVAKMLGKAGAMMQHDGAPPGKALELTRDAFSMLVRTHGALHPALIPVLNVYAFGCLQRRMLEEGEKATQIMTKLADYLALREREGKVLLGPLGFLPQRELAVMNANKMQIAVMKGDHAQAVEHARAALECFAAVPDEEGDETVGTAKEGLSVFLGVLLSSLGRNDEANAQFKGSLVEMVGRHSETSPAIAPPLYSMATHHMKMKNYDEATTLAATAYKNFHAALGEFHPKTMGAMRRVAEIALEAKQYRTAFRWLIELNRVYFEHLFRKRIALAPLDHARALHLLALAYLGLRDPRAALKVAHNSLQLHENAAPPDSALLCDPLQTWCHAFRLAGGHAVAPFHALRPLHRFLTVLNASEPALQKRRESWHRWYTLLHLAYYNYWLGHFEHANAAFAAFQTMPRQPYAVVRVWVNDVHNIVALRMGCAAMPGTVDPGSWQHFVALLLLMVTLDAFYTDVDDLRTWLRGGGPDAGAGADADGPNAAAAGEPPAGPGGESEDEGPLRRDKEEPAEGSGGAEDAGPPAPADPPAEEPLVEEPTPLDPAEVVEAVAQACAVIVSQQQHGGVP